MNTRIAGLSAALLAAALAAAPADASHRHGEVVRVRVIDVHPVYAYEEIPVERDVCRQELRRRGPNPAAGAIAGALVGGVIGDRMGNRFGDGRGQRAVTVAGAALGAAVGHEVGRDLARHHGRVVPVRRCDVVVHYETREVLVGYDVAYRYGGRVRHVRMDHDPGPSIDVEVDVRPLR
ncbi:glycine zipper 2TM domain-containing protein [Halomonas denitrificans]|nr:glycine zipper 2TM domain-containing protein [Halomonas denitrificans]